MKCQVMRVLRFIFLIYNATGPHLETTPALIANANTLLNNTTIIIETNPYPPSSPPPRRPVPQANSPPAVQAH